MMNWNSYKQVLFPDIKSSGGIKSSAGTFISPEDVLLWGNLT